MSMVTSLQRTVALSLCFAIALPSVAAEKKTPEATQPSYELPQPQRENLDLNMYQLIRQEGSRSLARDGVRLGAGGRHRTAPHRLAQSEARKRVDARSANSDGLRKCASGRLGRVRHGLAAAQYLGAHDFAGYGGAHRAGRSVVSGDQRPDYRAGGGGRDQGREGHRSVSRQARRQDRVSRRAVGREAGRQASVQDSRRSPI